MANLAELPAELLIDIVHSCSHTDIKHLSETCRLLHNKLLPELFRNLDLSTHNATIECSFDIYREGRVVRAATGRRAVVPPRFSAREWHSIDQSTARKQELLIRTIAEKPTYAKYVRELHWTVLDSHQNITHHRELFDARPRYWRAIYAETSWSKQGRVRDTQAMVRVYEPGSPLTADEKLHLLWRMFYDNDNRRTHYEKYERTLSKEREEFPPEDDTLWRTFHSFVHVVDVDLCWLRPWREATLPKKLFHDARSIRLGGRMTREFVTCVLGGSRLESINLNDLKLWAELETASNSNPKPSGSGLASLATDTAESELVPSASNQLQELRKYLDVNRARLQMRPHERVLADTLDTLAARQSVLKSLHITIAGPDTGYYYTPQDTSLYRSWARFLASARNTLCNLFFEQCEGIKESSGPRRGRERRQTQGIRQMDWLFAQQVLPVLLGAPWPQIKRMEIRGVGQIDSVYRSVYHYELERRVEVVRVVAPPKATEQLRKLLDYEAELVIEERSSAKCEHVDTADPGIPPIYSQWEDWKAIMDRRRKQNHRDSDSDSARKETGGLATCRISDYEQIAFRWSDGLIDEKSALRIADPEYVPDTELLGGPNPEIERA